MKTSRGNVKSFIAGALIMAIILSAGVAIAATERNISVIFRDIRLVVNGQQVTPRDAQGNIVEPFIWQGSTFLPVRAVGEALGMPVSWDGATSTVYVGATPGGAPFWTTVPFFQRGGSHPRLDTLTSIGQSFANAINLGGGAPRNGWSEHALNANFNTLTGTIGQVDGTSTTLTSVISFIGDGRELASFSIGGTDHPRDISVDVTGVLVLRVQFYQPASFGSVNRVFLANAMIH